MYTVNLEAGWEEVHKSRARSSELGPGLLGLRLNQLHLSLTHEVQCWTAIGSGVKNGDDGSSRSGKASLQMQPNGGAPKGMLWDAEDGGARTLSGSNTADCANLLHG